MSVVWEWIPNYGLGQIKLGDQINGYIEELHLLRDFTEEDDGTNWVGYKLPKVDTYIYTENEIITCITSYEEFIYNNKNIIGINENQLVDLLGCEPSDFGKSVLFDDGDIQTPLEYLNLGLQIWVSNGIVMSASIIKTG